MASTPIMDKLIVMRHRVVVFSSTAIALYGYDQGMMSLINTNHNYLQTMHIKSDSVMVGVIVAVYYLGCSVGAVLASRYSDNFGRKPSIFACVVTTAVGNLIMFLAGLGWDHGKAAQAVILVGRIVMGLGVGGIDAVVPVYSAEMSVDAARGTALAQEFQMNILGLNMAFAINLGLTIALGKDSQWAWRTPIIVMQLFPLILFSLIEGMPETPRWYLSKGKKDKAEESMERLFGKEEAPEIFENLLRAVDDESSKPVGYLDMLLPKGKQFHPTAVVIMGQINQALTGYGAVSVYGPQIFELLGFRVRMSEYLTMGNYVSYFFMMTFAWILIDKVGRRFVMIWGALGIAGSFAILALLGGLVQHPGASKLGSQISGTIILYAATAMFGIGWLPTVWLIPTEIYPSSARAQGSAISVVIWGLANFAITFLTPIGFNNLKYWLFLVFAVTNAFIGWWTWVSTTPSKMTVAPADECRRISQRLVEEHSRRTKLSLMMPRKQTRGKFGKLSMVCIADYPRNRRPQSKREKLRRCSGELEIDQIF
jgi:sugar porter (SP) family MFS transporter